MVRPIMFCALLVFAVAFAAQAPAHAQVEGQATPQSTVPEAPAGGQSLLDVTVEPADPARFACRMNLVRLQAEIPPDQRARPWLTSLLGREAAAADYEHVRSLCLSLLDEPLVRFVQD